jgi:hypothetical protein
MGNMIEMDVLDNTGHTRTTWDSDNPVEVDAARKQFTNLVGAGYKAFKVKKDGTEGEQMKTFDPDAEAMILMKALTGG